MAVVKRIDPMSLEVETRHTEAECTYSIVHYGGIKYLQIDTYGSPNRELRGKKSQSIRFAPEAIDGLKRILTTHFQRGQP